MILNYAKQQMALILGGSSTIVPTYVIIGTGSGVVTSGQSALITAADRQAITGSDVSTQYQVNYIADWTSIEMSGLQLTEFGMIASGTGLVGSIWSRSSFPSITFDGTNELRVSENWQVF